MPFDSNGVFSRVMNWTQDQQDGIAIECGRHDDEDDNFANGFNDCFCRDGRAAATGNFNLGSHKIQNLAAGTATTDAVNKGQIDNITTNMVKISGNQTIAGTKTFSASPNVPTPATSDNSTKVATTAYVKNQGYAPDNTVVHLTGNQTIAGTKTFSSTISGSINGNAATVTNGVYTTGNQTIGGTKKFSNNILTIIDATRNVVPSAIKYGGFGIRDNADNLFASLVSSMDTNKNATAFLRVYNPNNTSTSDATYMILHYDADGLKYVTAPASDVNTSIVTTVNKSKAANGYFQLGNGLIVQWGRITVNSEDGTVTLPKAFTSTNYTTLATYHNSTGLGSNRGHPVIKAQTTTTFTWYCDSATSSLYWIAIGY